MADRNDIDLEPEAGVMPYGMAVAGEGEDICPTCAGAGRIDGQRCRECGGDGRVTERIAGG